MRIYADRLTSVRTLTIIIYIYCIPLLYSYKYIFRSSKVATYVLYTYYYVLYTAVYSGIVRVVDRRRNIIVL